MTRVRVAIIGAGFAGIGTALRLQGSGENSFIVLERSDGVGGTWHDNTYPGAACDVPSHLYCFSFLPNPQFSRRLAPGREIREYLERAAEPIVDHLRLSCALDEASWTGSHWHLKTSRGDLEAEVLVVACGRLTEPRLPDVAGSFGGPLFHSSAWDDQVELRGARVAVVGTGASAVQLVPHVAAQAASLVVMQRSASYILPRVDAAYTPSDQADFLAHPATLTAVRTQIEAEADDLYDARVGDPSIRAAERTRALAHLADQIADPRVRHAVSPTDEFGCKRVLFSNDYYPALSRSDVTVTGPLAAFGRNYVVDAAGARYEVDIVVLATGFHATRQAYARLIHGRDGRSLDDHWADGMRAYASTTVHGFPNMFVINGPHASLSHNSATLMIETQIEYVLQALSHLTTGVSLEVKVDAEDQYADEMARRSSGLAWTSGCSNSYVDARNGRQVLLWPGLAAEFAERLGHVDLQAYQLEGVRAVEAS